MNKRKINLNEPAVIRQEKTKRKFQLYEDRKGEYPIENVVFDEIIEVGSTVEKIFYLKNISENPIDKIEVKIEDPDANVVIDKDILQSGEIAEVKVYWSPSEDRRHGLNAPIKIRGRVLYPP